jgi:hypothetical protein
MRRPRRRDWLASLCGNPARSQRQPLDRPLRLRVLVAGRRRPDPFDAAEGLEEISSVVSDLPSNHSPLYGPSSDRPFRWALMRSSPLRSRGWTRPPPEGGLQESLHVHLSGRADYRRRERFVSLPGHSLAATAGHPDHRPPGLRWSWPWFVAGLNRMVGTCASESWAAGSWVGRLRVV